MNRVIQLVLVAFMPLMWNVQSDAQFDEGFEFYSPIIKVPTRLALPVPVQLTAPVNITKRPLEHQLTNTRISLDLEEIPLREVIRVLHKATGMPVDYNEISLNDEGIELDQLITFQCKNSTVDSAIRRMLNPLNCSYVAKEGVIVLCSVIEECSTTIVKIYPVSDLVLERGSRDPNAVNLIKIIESTVHTDTWASVGGEGTVEFFRPCMSLVVSHYAESHDRVADLLTLLRKSQALAGSQAFPSHEKASGDEIPSRSPVIYLNPWISKIESQLQTKTVSISYVDKPLGDIITDLMKLTDIELAVDVVPLEDEGITLDTPLTIELNDVTLHVALTHMLRRINATYVVRHESALITSETEAGQEQEIRCYPVSDLVSITSDDQRYSFFHEELIELLESVVQPDSWSTVGGEGSVDYYASSQLLVINQTPRTHDQIEDCMNAIRLSHNRVRAIHKAAGLLTLEEINQHCFKERFSDL